MTPSYPKRSAWRALAAATGVIVGLAAFAPAANATDTTTVKWLYLENNPQMIEQWKGIISAYEKDHPNTKIKTQFLENQAFKAKLPTMLQSSDAPDMFYSWSGGVMRAQADTGALRPIGDKMTEAWKKRLNPAALNSFTYKDKIWGGASQMSIIDFYYNKAMFKKAGVDASNIKTWADFLDAVKKLKAAGITPIAVGGGDKWPIHFYYAYLAMRIGGKQAFDDAESGKGKGFASQPFVEAGKKLKELADLKPFQKGYLGATYPSMLGQFGDGKAAMILCFSGSYKLQANQAADGKGQAESNMGMFPFPVVKGGNGKSTDTFGGINGWIVSRNAPDQTIDFINYLTNTENQKKQAASGIYLPAVPAANSAIKDPLLKQAAEELSKSTWHQIYLDQDLGPDVGLVVNDVATDIVSGDATPADAAQKIQELLGPQPLTLDTGSGGGRSAAGL